VGSPLTAYNKSKMVAVAVLDLWLNANNFGLDGYLSMKVGEIIEWSGNRLRSTQMSDMTKPAAGTKFAMPWPPS